MGNKTADGIRLTDVVKAALQAGARMRDGNSHLFILNYDGMRPCPVASSTHAERMVAPWLARATGATKQEAYTAIRRGYW